MNGGMKINMLGFVHVHDTNGHHLEISSSDIMIIIRVINGEKLLLIINGHHFVIWNIHSFDKNLKYGSFPKISSHGTHGSFRSHGLPEGNQPNFAVQDPTKRMGG